MAAASARVPTRQVRAILALPRPTLLAFDVDGTLAPIVRDPEKARVPAPVVRALSKLSTMPGLHLAVITGRDPDSLTRMLPMDQLYRGVLHGKQVLRPGEPPRALALRAGERRALAAFEAFAHRELTRPGVTLEAKPGAWGVHVRKLSERDPGAAGGILDRVRQEAARLGLEAREGRAIVEVETRSGDKGEALARIHRMSRARSVVFLGDDLTDVPALRYASERGMGLFVRSAERPRRPPGITGSLPGVEQVHALIRALAAELDGG